jgi:hypothetical protein
MGVALRTSGEGYEEVIDLDTGERAYVHRLVALARGDPRRVVRSDVHHRSGVQWDNRPANLSCRRPHEHRARHLNG